MQKVGFRAPLDTPGNRPVETAPSAPGIGEKGSSWDNFTLHVRTYKMTCARLPNDPTMNRHLGYRDSMKRASLGTWKLWSYLALEALLVFPLASSEAIAQPDESHIIEVTAGAQDRTGGPVVVDLPAGLKLQNPVWLKRLDNGIQLPAQIEKGEGRRLWWILTEPLPKAQTRRYAFSKLSAPPPKDFPSRVTVTDDGSTLQVQLGTRPVLHYCHATVPSPDVTKPYYDRSGFIHPVFSPSGLVMTDGMPIGDHTHQHGVMFAWRQAQYESREVDFWNVATGLGRVEHASVDHIDQGPVWGGFQVTLRHFELKAPGGPRQRIHETWNVRVYAQAKPFLWDFESRQIVTGNQPLEILEFNYGGMMIRGSRQWRDVANCGFLTSLGDSRETGNHTRPKWVEMFGPVDGQEAGIVVLGDPQNYRSPQPVRLHPSMPYFCFAPMVLGEFDLLPNKTFQLQYRFFTHDGPPDPTANDQRWNNFAEPPLTRVLPEEN